MVVSEALLERKQHHEDWTAAHHDRDNRYDHNRPRRGRSGNRDANRAHTLHRYHPRSTHWGVRWILCQLCVPAECRAEWEKGTGAAVKARREDSLPGRLQSLGVAPLRAVFFA